MSKDKEKKSDTARIKEELFYERVNTWDRISEKDEKKVEDYNKSYREFLDAAKTEREAVDVIVPFLEGKGYSDIFKSESADKTYYNHYGKSLAIYRTGKKALSEGLNILVAHLDSPRLDVKQNPMYEDTDLVFLKTHYYGGVKKYQWLSRPLAIHGVLVFADGSKKTVVVGEDDKDPVMTIADLLPHLAKKAQMTKNAAEFIPGEKLNVIIGSKPLGKEKEDQRTKAAVMQLLNKKYNFKEEDFLSADLEIVPAGKARNVGLDASLIGAYGHDDRVCAYASLRAIVDAKEPETASLVLLMDKEEIGSEGATGSNTWFLEMVVGEILAKSGDDEYRKLRRILSGASCLSADVNAALHPDWAEVHDKRNSGYINGGLVISKFTGSGGKGGSSEANAEFVAVLRKVFADNDVVWHMAELGKVDEGGGGTIAKYMSYYGMNVIDAGVAVLDMHSPFEIVSKADTWMMYKGFKAFLQDN